MFQNFKLIFKMRTPIATNSEINFDALLSFCICKKETCENFFVFSGKQDDLEDLDLNILDEKFGVYTASSGIGYYREFFGSWKKQFCYENDNLIDFRNVKKRIDIGCGHFKAYNMPLELRAYENILFYVRGDKEKILDLINNHLFNIGKKASQGFGEINEFEAVDMEEDYSIFKDGRLMRPIPMTEETVNECLHRNTKFRIILRPKKPPYWRQDCLVKCIF